MRMQERGAFDGQCMASSYEEIRAKLEARDNRLLLTAGDFNPCLGKRFFILYACHRCRWAPIVQSAWYLVVTPGGLLHWHCALCGQRYRWGEGAPHRALVLCWQDEEGRKFVHMWRIGDVSHDTEGDIVVLRALVLHNNIANTTIREILAGLQRLSELAMRVCEEYGVGVHVKSNPLTDVSPNAIVEYDYRVSLPCRAGVWIRAVNVACVEVVDERLLREMLAIMLDRVVSTHGGVASVRIPDNFGAKSMRRLHNLVRQL